MRKYFRLKHLLRPWGEGQVLGFDNRGFLFLTLVFILLIILNTYMLLNYETLFLVDLLLVGAIGVCVWGAIGTVRSYIHWEKRNDYWRKRNEYWEDWRDREKYWENPSSHP